jgi:hypothetical protein
MDALERDLRNDLILRTRKVRHVKNVRKTPSKIELRARYLSIDNIFTHFDNVKSFAYPKQLELMASFEKQFLERGTLTDKQFSVANDILTRVKAWHKSASKEPRRTEQ